ncbi:MAG: alpha/beta hydrolase, partial [Pseudomonadota bacterium]|nr:alpha/beta hydrolase [Pseudomonadota bacterium]
VAPARAKGYTQIWLVGISIGAFGALIYTEAQPQDIAGVVALGPYLGKRSLTEEINAQGGLRRWHAPTGRLDPEDIDTQLWRWLQPPGSSTPSRAAMADPRPDLFLGYGRSDRFIFSDTLLAATLPSNRVFTTDGGHDWAAWLALWRSMLDAMPLRRDASCRPSI